MRREKTGLRNFLLRVIGIWFVCQNNVQNTSNEDVWSSSINILDSVFSAE